MSRFGERPSFLRLLRFVAAGLFIALGLTLSATSFSGYRIVQGALQTVIRGQGESLMQSIDRLMRRSPPNPEEMARTLLDNETPRGLRCLVLFESAPGPVKRALLAVGDCATPRDSWVAVMGQQRRGEIVQIGERMRMVMGPPPHMGPPPPHMGPPPDGPPGSNGPHLPPTPVLMEFAPYMAEHLQSSARRTLGTGAIAALALLLSAAVFWQLSLRAERNLQTQERQRQLASLGEMAAVLAHELRNPMAALKGHAQLLLEQLPAGSKQHDKANRVVSEAERLEALSEDLLSFVRTTAIEPQDINPVELLQECISTVSAARIDLASAGAPARWHLDPARMSQVFENLLRNAVEASPPESRVQATVRSEPGALVFEVRDFGPGIRDPDLERIFEPFYTTRARGTGLGLAIARRLVSLHGGSITAENAAAGGALFRVCLPAALSRTR